MIEDPRPDDDWNLTMAILVATLGRINVETKTRDRYSQTLTSQMVQAIELVTRCLIQKEGDPFLLAMEGLFDRVTDEDTFIILTEAASTIIPPAVTSCDMLQCRVLKAMNQKGIELGLEQIDAGSVKMINDRIEKGVN